jgi:hypothetical protein
MRDDMNYQNRIDRLKAGLAGPDLLRSLATSRGIAEPALSFRIVQLVEK